MEMWERWGGGGAEAGPGPPSGGRGQQLAEMEGTYSIYSAVFRVAAIIRVAAVFGALKIIFSELFFLHDNFQIRKNQNQKKNFENFFFLCPFF